MERRYVLAEPTGLCFGVQRAIHAMEQALSKGEPLYCLGEPIHNPQEVARLEQKGMKIIQSPTEAPQGATVFLRAHGVTPLVRQQLRQKGNSMVDGSCPFVKVAQARVKELEDEGRTVVLAGNAEHPEVKAILGCLDREAIVVLDSTEAAKIDILPKIGVLSQTTLPERTFSEIVAQLVFKTADLRVCKTICDATVSRQAAMVRLAKQCDGIVLLGGRNSANTAKLYQIGREAGGDVVWIEEASQIDTDWLATKAVLGIAAGASTPDWLIEQFITAAREVAYVKGDVRHE